MAVALAGMVLAGAPPAVILETQRVSTRDGALKTRREILDAHSSLPRASGLLGEVASPQLVRPVGVFGGDWWREPVSASEPRSKSCRACGQENLRSAVACEYCGTSLVVPQRSTNSQATTGRKDAHPLQPQSGRHLSHGDFVLLYAAGKARVWIDESIARSLVENHPAMPRRYYRAHMFWSWVWLLSGLVSLGLIPLVLGLRKAINRSACEFVIELARENASFHGELASKGWLRVDVIP